MSSLIDDYLNQVGQKKTTAPHTLYSGPVMDPLAPLSAMPAVDFRVKIMATSGGTCVVTGSLDGSPKSESLSVTANVLRSFTNSLDVVTGISCTCPTGTITTTCYDLAGALISSTTYTDFACRWEDEQQVYMNGAGAWAQSSAKVITQAAYVVGDVIRKSGTTTEYSIKKVKTANDLAGNEEFRIFIL